MGRSAGDKRSLSRRGAALLALLALTSLGAGQAGAQRAQLEITAKPSLYPSFDPGVADYVARCRQGHAMTLSMVAASGTVVSVDGQPALGGSFSVAVPLASGQAVRFVVRNGQSAHTYQVRCLPPDFPQWTVERPGQPQAAFYVVDPCCHRKYAIIFDNHGVPVWWLHTNSHILDAAYLRNGDVAVGVDDGRRLSQGLSDAAFKEFRLDGKYVRTFTIPNGTLTDRHELQLLPNGDYIVVAHVPRGGVDLRPYGGPANATVFDDRIYEVSPHNKVVWSWSSRGHIRLSETGRWYKALVLTHPAQLSRGHIGYDIVHINSVEPYGNDFLVSFRHTDAIYLIDKATGRIEWKLGGTHTPQSLRIIGDDVPDFGGQHDARVLPDGTVTVFDNGTGRGRPPRALRFRIDTRARTATLLERLVGNQTPSSPCCGSARKLPGGDWVISWGGTELVTELTPSDQPVFELDFHLSTSYRAQPLLPGQVSLRRLNAAMDSMHPRSGRR